MLKLTFKQTQAEIMVRAASTILFNQLVRAEYPCVPLSQLSEDPQYGYTASAEHENVGPKFVRITGLQDGSINWSSVPYCKCDEPEKYLLLPNDILFVRTGATTRKTHLVRQFALIGGLKINCIGVLMSCSRKMLLVFALTMLPGT